MNNNNIRHLLELIFFLFSFPYLGLSQKDSTKFEVYILNQIPDAVPQNARLEIGVSIPTSIQKEIQFYLDSPEHRRWGLNPFLSWNFQVKARFYNKNKGTNYPIEGFWYQEMERNVAQNKWNILSNEFPFRIRFAPPETGDWTAQMEVILFDSTIYVSDTLNFNVIPSNFGGFVTARPETHLLERDGKVIVPTGVNLPFPWEDNNLIYSLDKDEPLNISAWVKYRKMIQDYIQQGGEYFRLFLNPAGSDFEFEEVGSYSKRQNFAWELDYIFDLCEKNNVLIDFNILYHTVFMKTGDYHQFRYDYSDYWPESAWPYIDPNPTSGYAKLLNSRTPSDMFLDEVSLIYLKERIRYIMARWGYSNSIAVLELASEPWHIDENNIEDDVPYFRADSIGDIARKAAYNYHKEIANYIKDELGYKQLLLGAVGTLPMGKAETDIFSHLYLEDMERIDSTWFLKNIDVIGISFYNRSPEAFIITKWSENNSYGAEENSIARVIDRLHRKYKKPVLFSESDSGDSSYDCSDSESFQFYTMRYPFTGASGHFVWAAFFPTNKEKYGDSILSWKGIIQAKDYFNSLWFNDFLDTKRLTFGRTESTFRRSENDLLEQQYMINEAQDKAAGYIYNRTFNLQTAGGKSFEEIQNTVCYLEDSDLTIPTVITWKPQRLYIEGLKRKTTYNITYYGYQSREIIQENTVKSTLSGRIVLKHPDLGVSKDKNPLIWYRVEQKNN